MATEISSSLFEKNAKVFNKKGLRRRYSSIPTRVNEYAKTLPLGLRSEFVFECTVDKDSYQKVADLIKNEGFKLIGSKNTLFFENIINDFDANPEMYANLKAPVDGLRKDLENLKAEQKDFEEMPDDDVKFYFYPYNDNIKTLCDFVEQEKDKFLNLAKQDDVTIILKVVGHTELINGFYGFNFFDADKGDEEVIVDYASTLTVNTDFNEPGKVLVAAYYLSGIATDPEDLELLNTHIFAENLRFTKD